MRKTIFAVVMEDKDVLRNFLSKRLIKFPQSKELFLLNMSADIAKV
jgi:hypothetical protein